MNASALPVPWQPRARPVERFAGPYTFGEHTFEVRGASMPIIQVRLVGALPIHFDVHTLLWRDPTVQIDRGPARGQYTASGEELMPATASGQGCLACGPHRSGCVFMLYLPAGKAIEVRKGHCLCAAGTRYEGSSTTTLERFTATETDGLLVLCGRGNAFELMLEPDETLHLQPYALLYKDQSVTIAAPPAPSRAGALLRCTGPGLIAMQTVGWSG